MIKQAIPTEHQEQSLLVEYLELLKKQGKVLIYGALPNNTYTKSWSQKRKQTAEGVKKGFPDMVIVFPGKVLFLEMKRSKGGVVSPDQWLWLKALADKETQTAVAKGFDQAKEIVDSFVERTHDTSRESI